MPSSSIRRIGGIRVIVHPRTGSAFEGVLNYSDSGPEIRLDNGDVLEDIKGATFSVTEKSELADMAKLDSRDQIVIEPITLTQLNYSPRMISQLQMYPPSTNGWFEHVVDSGNQSIFTVQKIVGKTKQLLVIVDKDSGELFFASQISSYESSILGMDRDWDIHNEILFADVSETDIFDILKEKSLSWSTLEKLVEGVSIPDLAIRQTMEETLDQLVPNSFSPNVKQQLMAFLGWLEKAKIPDEDPVDFARKHRSVSVYRYLVRGHLQCILDNVEPPPYVRLLHMADKGQIELIPRPQSEAAGQNPWNLVRVKLSEMFPDWTGRVVEYMTELQTQGRIVTKLPVTRDEAKNSQEAWSNRFAMAYHGSLLRGHIFKESIGLVPAVYVGGAHRWPHKHLEWSARLGYGMEKPQYVQIMVMPKSALERISRIIPSVRLIDWEMSCVNLALYDHSMRKWTLNKSMILKSMERRRNPRQLANEFGKWTGKKTHIITKRQVRVLDLISWALYLGNMETELYANYYGLDNSTIDEELNNLYQHNIFALQYFLIPMKLRSICIIANGPSQNICSLSRAFLKHTPSTQVRLMSEGKSSIIVSRVPEDEYYDLIKELTAFAQECDISLRAVPISAYAGYRNNLYSRLLKSDGSWDDDVSGLLNQVSLRPKKTQG